MVYESLVHSRSHKIRNATMSSGFRELRNACAVCSSYIAHKTEMMING